MSNLDRLGQFFEAGTGANNGTQINTAADTALQTDVIDILGGRSTRVNALLNKFSGRKLALRIQPGADATGTVTGTLQVDLRASSSITSAGALDGTITTLQTWTLTAAQFAALDDVDVDQDSVWHGIINYNGTHGRYLDVQLTPSANMSTLLPVVQVYLVDALTIREYQGFTKVASVDRTAL